MILIPAVDIRAGRAVRLRRGDFGVETVYDDDPVGAARAWVDAGARRLHVVDLDGARYGAPRALGELRAIGAALAVPIQYGGGLRDEQAIAAALDAGAAEVVLGTAALADERFLAAALERFGGRVTVAVDARRGRVAVAGWTETTDVRADELVVRLAERGVERVIYTDIERDGMLEGPDLEGLRMLRAAAGAGTELVASGGVGSLEHVRALGALAREGGAQDSPLTAVIAGKALYERAFTVAEGQAALDEAEALH